MFRRILPAIITLFFVLLDTAILPFCAPGVIPFSPTFVLSLCNGLLLGPLRGLLYGFFSGLLIDISAGTLGYTAFLFASCGIVVTILVVDKTNVAYSVWMKYLRRFGRFLILFLISELFMGTYRYFVNASMSWLYVMNAVVRSILCTITSSLLYPVLAKLYGNRRLKAENRSK